MKTRTLRRTSVFPASEAVVFARLKELKTLQYVASPYASFIPVDGQTDLQWAKGQVFRFAFKLFALVPFGTHTIRVIEFSDTNHRIYTRESNTHVPVWNHRILLRPLDSERTQYTDEVEIGAGVKTLFVYLWAKCFYAHRQKKWIRMLREESENED